MDSAFSHSDLCSFCVSTKTYDETEDVYELVSSVSDCLDHCGGTEALVRLVLSGLVGIATVVFLVDHVRICSEKRRAPQ